MCHAGQNDCFEIKINYSRDQPTVEEWRVLVLFSSAELS